MPEEQHGCLQGKGIHTALIPNLAAIEANLSNPDQAEDYRFVGGADLSKAFDRLAWKHSTAAMQRMGIPAGINNAIPAAWRQQQRWLTTANYVSNRPYPTQCLPQGDSASPIGLLATMSEAYRRIRAAHPQDQHGPQRHSIFVDDRFWLTTRASTCVSIARAWQQATAMLRRCRTPPTKLESQESSDQGCESWVHSHNPTAEQADLQMRSNTGSTKLLRSFGGRACSHTIPLKRQLLPKQLEWHLRLPPATANSQQQRASTHSVCLWRKSMVTLLSTVGHYFDYLLDTQQTLITELATSWPSTPSWQLPGIHIFGLCGLQSRPRDLSMSPSTGSVDRAGPMQDHGDGVMTTLTSSSIWMLLNLATRSSPSSTSTISTLNCLATTCGMLGELNSGDASWSRPTRPLPPWPIGPGLKWDNAMLVTRATCVPISKPLLLATTCLRHISRWHLDNQLKHVYGVRTLHPTATTNIGNALLSGKDAVLLSIYSKAGLHGLARGTLTPFSISPRREPGSSRPDTRRTREAAEVFQLPCAWVLQRKLDYMSFQWFMISVLRWFIDWSVHCSLVHWFMASLLHGFIQSVAHGTFHVISLASLPPFAHSLTRFTTSTLHCFFISKAILCFFLISHSHVFS